MRKNTRIKVLAVILVVIMVIGTCSVASATQARLYGYRIYGGASQTIATMARERNYNIEQNVTELNLNGQSNWKMRGYNQSTGLACTEISSAMTAAGRSYLANFTSKPATVQVKNSIASSNTASYLTFSGIIYA